MRYAAIAVMLVSGTALADEGMWTFDNFPASKVDARYGFNPNQEWLDHVRLASVRLAQGCSGSFVSPSGLVLTNHHCAHRCIQQLSSAAKDYVESGFYAATEEAEARCPELEINQLVEISDVTKRVDAATAGKSDAAYAGALKAVTAAIEKECAESEALRCEVVSLYHGGVYALYQYRRFQDVRLVFAPELEAAFFGGDPDNFNFPRYDLDMAMLRVYEQGRPAETHHYFRWSAEGAKPGTLTFVSGNPGGTSRELTVVELEYQRDVAVPRRLLWLAQLRGFLHEYRRRGPEQARHALGMLFGVENSFKAFDGMFEALTDETFFAHKIAEQAALRRKLESSRSRRKLYAAAYAAIERTTGELEAVREPLALIEQAEGFGSQLFDIARKLVRAAVELPKPNAERLEEYTDPSLPQLRQSLFSPAPIYPELEQARLSLSLTHLLSVLGMDHPLVLKLLAQHTPEQLAREVVSGTGLADVEVRRKLFEGGEAVVQAATDPMIRLALLVEPYARDIRKLYEEQIASVIDKNSELIARGRFKVYGTSVYPDATFTPRLSYGAVEGWVEQGRPVPPLTDFAGAFARHTGQPPFALPPSWLAAKEKLGLETPLNFVTTNDIIGGNSGSPVIDKDARLVGLIFDGNIHSLGGKYGFDPRLNRAVAVHSAGMLEALRVIYGAERLLAELRGAGGGSPAGTD